MAQKKALLYNETVLWGRWWGSGGPRRHRLSSYVAPAQPLVHAAGIDVLGNMMPSSLDREESILFIQEEVFLHRCQSKAAQHNHPDLFISRFKNGAFKFPIRR